jgi:hypothetical protein
LLHSVQTVSGVHPASHQTGAGEPFLGNKPQKHKADHSPPYSAEAKNSRAILPVELRDVEDTTFQDNHLTDGGEVKAMIFIFVLTFMIVDTDFCSNNH